MARGPWRAVFRGGALAATIASAAVAAHCWNSYGQDRAALRQVVRQVVSADAPPAQRVLALLHWVHALEGTRRNERYFGWRRLRATPVQVLSDGGDCADKSRLLAAALRESGIPATMALCLDRPGGTPAHTLVEATIGPGEYMVVDPAFDLYLPREDGSGTYDLLDLRREPELVDRRVAAVRAALPPQKRPASFYLRSAAAYDTAMTLNWNKNRVMRWLHDALKSSYGEQMYRVPRPRFLEEPKLAVAASGLLFACLAFGVLTCSSLASKPRSLHAALRALGAERGPRTAPSPA